MRLRRETPDRAGSALEAGPNASRAESTGRGGGNGYPAWLARAGEDTWGFGAGSGGGPEAFVRPFRCQVMSMPPGILSVDPPTRGCGFWCVCVSGARRHVRAGLLMSP